MSRVDILNPRQCQWLEFEEIEKNKRERKPLSQVGHCDEFQLRKDGAAGRLRQGGRMRETGGEVDCRMRITLTKYLKYNSGFPATDSPGFLPMALFS